MYTDDETREEGDGAVGLVVVRRGHAVEVALRLVGRELLLLRVPGCPQVLGDVQLAQGRDRLAVVAGGAAERDVCAGGDAGEEEGQCAHVVSG